MCSAWQILEEESLPECSVQTLMTKDPVTVTPNARIGVLAKMMLNAHIHRVVVVDERAQPIGIVSTTDILAAVARARNGSGEVTSPLQRIAYVTLASRPIDSYRRRAAAASPRCDDYAARARRDSREHPVPGG